MGEIRDVSDELFKDLLRKEKRFIVLEFWSPGCSVCKEVEPELLKAQKELGEDAIFMKINTDHQMWLASKYQVTGTPTFVYFCDGKKVGGNIGYINATVLRNTIKDILRHSVSCPRTKRMNYEMDGYS
ncbi:MAG: thioredoxin family protein [Methanomassiliicoccales archaeon]|nr:thioredoxin family protein [Methanomassiliicoccales archaeon]